MLAFLEVLKFFPYVFQAVNAVETTIGSESGATKKQVILDSILAVAGVAETVSNPLVALIGKLIDGIVLSLNTSGVFTHAPVKAP